MDFNDQEAHILQNGLIVNPDCSKSRPFETIPIIDEVTPYYLLFFIGFTQNYLKSVTTLLRGVVLLIVPQSGTMLLWCTRDRVMPLVITQIGLQALQYT